MGLFGRKQRERKHPYYPGNNSSNPNAAGEISDYDVHMQSAIASRRSMHLSHTIDDNDKQAKGGVGAQLRKLNCAGSKKHHTTSTLENMMYVPSARNKGRKVDEGDRITRPVLVTVKDGDMPYVTPATNESGTIELKNSFVIGKRAPQQQAPHRSSPQRSSPQRSSPQRSSPPQRFSPPRPDAHRYTTTTSFAPPGCNPALLAPSSRKDTRSAPRRSKDMHDFVSTQERERRQDRWKKGIQKSWKEEGDFPSLVSGEDSTAYGGGQSVMTGFDTVGTGRSGYTGYSTSATESDDSEDSPKSRHNRYRPPNRPRSSIRKQGSSRPKKVQSLKRNNNDGSLWAGVAEDLGIVAGMLLSDGSACFSGAAAIAQESIKTQCQ